MVLFASARASTRRCGSCGGVRRLCVGVRALGAAALRVHAAVRLLRPARVRRRKARKSFEHDPAQDPDGGAIPDITYPHLGKRNMGHVEKPPSAVQRLQDRTTDLLGVWRQDPTPTHPFGLEKFKGSQRESSRRGQVRLKRSCPDAST